MNRNTIRLLSIGSLLLLSSLFGAGALRAAKKPRGTPSCTDKNGTSLGCVGRIGFIGFDLVGQLGPMIPVLEAAKAQLWPSRGQLRFEVVTFGAGDIDALCDEVEALVVDMQAHGYDRIALPSLSTFLAPYIQGTCGSLTGTVDVRHPGVVFAVINPGTSAANGVPNLFRFLDVNTQTSGDESVGPLVGAGGEMLILYESGDGVSESIRDQFLATASSLSITATTWAVPYTVGFDMSGVAPLVAALPAGSLVVHIVNGVHVEDYATAGNAAGGIFVAESGAGPIRHFGGNFYVFSTTIPVDLELGLTTLDDPSLEMEQLGFAVDRAGWLADGRQTLYVEAYAWMATRGRTVGVHDHHLQFDALGTRINYRVGFGYVPANTTGYLIRDEMDNPRWFTDRHAWDWGTIFGNN